MQAAGKPRDIQHRTVQVVEEARGFHLRTVQLAGKPRDIQHKTEQAAKKPRDIKLGLECLLKEAEKIILLLLVYNNNPCYHLWILNSLTQ